MTSEFLNMPISSEGTLHRPDFEKDSCGVGFVAHIEGQRSNKILRYGLTSVCNMTHRGAVDADQKTGDGAGVLTQLPYKILMPEIERLGYSLERESDLGVGVFFLPLHDESAQMKGKILAEGIVRNRGLRVLGWREVPVNPRELGEKARATMPKILHCLVAKPSGMDADRFERELYLARRQVGLRAEEEKITGFYSPSFSHRTISYKALAIATAVEKFYTDLQDSEFETAICLYHQRFSTNTFPTWPLCQPFRMLAHNCEINTVKGNRNLMASRESDFEHEFWGEDVDALKPLLDPNDSDSASLDSALELLVLSGRSVEEAMALLIPPAYRIDPFTSEEERAFYQYQRSFAEPWDGPAGLVFTDGNTVAACLDRNGLRPARFKLTSDGIFTVGSEVGVIDLPDNKIVAKGRLAPGEMISVDTSTGLVRTDREIKMALATKHPYGRWLKENRYEFKHDRHPRQPEGELDILTLSQMQTAFGYDKEELDMVLTPMVKGGEEAVYSMGDDIPLSVLSLQPRLLYTYFKQLFAQVTNPPIDPIRERLVMSHAVSLGWYRNILKETPEHARIVWLNTPFLFDSELESLKSIDADFPSRTLDITWPAEAGAAGMEAAVDRICAESEEAADQGVRLLILSDRATGPERVAIPALVATGAVHQSLIRASKRLKLSLVVDSAEARDTHQIACLFGFGAQAVCPYLAFHCIRELLETDKKGNFEGIGYTKALTTYRSALEKGVLKIMSKMGISVLSSYQGAHIFEAVGLGKQLMDKCFAGTPSQIDGIGFVEVAAESLARHAAGFGEAVPSEPLKLGDPGYNRFRRDGERHAIHAQVLKNFHSFVRDNEPAKYEEYVRQIKEVQPIALHDLMELTPLSRGAIPLEEVEPVEDIRVRFTTAAMSLGAISPEAHETLAIAMNEIGGKSDSGEGGEDPRRFKRYENGDWANSKIKQVASGRFGVSAEYLASAEELEIKMAQGAKPGEGGQLPGHKVNGIIAKLRHTQPGVTLISPPPHHDIYSIEDLAQLIHDLKEVNPRARVCVKLVAETGVGTVAAGVAKANADIILVSGHEGGTGASPLSSIKHAGLPWEIGLAETQQVLMLNGLRDRVTLRTDGGMRTGHDIIKAAILGAEEFNFGTIALIAMGCVYVRRCHLNTCPVGIATQDPKYREKFKGTKDHVINFFNAVAEETRQIMADLGVAHMNDLIGKPGTFLQQRDVPGHPKANMISLARVLKDVAKENQEDLARTCLVNRNDGIHAHPLDDKFIEQAREAIVYKHPVRLAFKVKNTNRNIGTKLAGEIAYHHGNHGLPEGTITLELSGSAGQSLGTFLCGGIRIILTGEANDYVGKGMCAGEIIIKPNADITFDPGENNILGNTVMYGATGGHLFACGKAGERFCVRNSGGTAVVEGIGDHGCEYMTNGTVVVLGKTGKNFGAGMSGGTAYVWNQTGNFPRLFNPEMIEAVPLEDPEDIALLRGLIESHAQATGSARAQDILDHWDAHQDRFLKVQPKSDGKPSLQKEIEQDEKSHVEEKTDLAAVPSGFTS
ncbi:glutamate synthase large subunit [soil metagenome]